MTVQQESWADLLEDRPTVNVPTRFTDPQHAFLESLFVVSVLWGGNSLGKSVILAELARRAWRGELPWQTPGQPYTVLLCGNTWSQLGSTLKYLFAGVEPGEFKKGIRYEGGTVKGQRLSVFEVVGGKGKGSELRLGTFRAQNLAGPRIDVVLSDEPLPEDVHAELYTRLLGRNGRMYVTFTPTLGTAADIDYLWRLVDDPQTPEVGEIRAPLTVANCTPRGGRYEIPFVRQAEIDRLRKSVSPIQADMRLGLSRYPRRDCTYFEDVWDPSLCRVDYVPPPGTYALVGIDHGSKAGAQVATLLYANGSGFRTTYHAADMYISTGRSEMTEDARGIVEMLWRNGLAHPRKDLEGKPLAEILAHRAVNGVPTLDLGDVDLWMGDRSHGGYRGGKGAKSNGDLQRAIAELIGFDTGRSERWEWREKLPGPLRKIRQPKKRRDSMWDGMEVVRRLMPQRLTIARHERMDPMAKAFATWQGALLDPMRDRLDSLRYPVVEVDAGRWRPVF